MKTWIQILVAAASAAVLLVCAAIFGGGGLADGKADALAKIERHVQNVYGQGDESRYLAEEQKLTEARHWVEPEDAFPQRQIYGWVTGSPRRDDWPEDWRAHPEYAQNYGTLFRIDTGDSGDGSRFVWLAASREALAPGGYVFALGDVVSADDGIVRLDFRYLKIFTGEEFEAELTQKSYEYLYNTEFDKLLLAKLHELFPEIVDEPGQGMNLAERVAAYCRANPIALLGILAIAVLVAFAAGKYIVGEDGAEDGGAQEEMCPYHKIPLVDGQCPHGCTITRCADCGAIMMDGKCPNGCKEPEVCPSCGSDILEDGSCPNGCTIIRCTECGAIMKEGVCPHGCNADPLHFGWGGSQRPEMTDFSLEVVTPEEYAGFAIDVPASFVVGRSAIEAREPFLELLVLDNAKKQECSRRYVRFDLLDDGMGYGVSMLKNHNFAYVNNRKISREGDCERLYEGETIRLNPNFELRLGRRPGAESAPDGDDPTAAEETPEIKTGILQTSTTLE